MTTARASSAMRRPAARLAFCSLAIASALPGADAATITRDAAAVHAMTSEGHELHSFSTYLTGFEGNGFISYERRSYYSFNLSAIAGPIVEATLTLWSPPPLPINNFSGGYRSSRDEETFELHEVLTPAADIAAIPFSVLGTEGVLEVWEDLGDGPAFGSVVMTADDEPLPGGKDIVVTLNNAALTSLNAAATGAADGGGTDWTVGGIVVEGETPFVSGNWQLFGGASPYYHDPEFRAPLPVLTLVTAETSLPGDYNSDRKVDTFDYDLWRQTYGSTTDLRADGNNDLVVDAADYTVWRDNLSATSAVVPEPAAAVLVLVAGAFPLGVRRGR